MKKHQWISSINLIIALVLINVVLSYYQFWRIDLTTSRIHSLSGATKKIVKELPDIVNVKVFLTQDLPAEAKTVAIDLKTILGEINRLNPGRFKVNYIDPNETKEGQIEAQRLGIQPLQFSTVKADKFEIQTGYFGLALEYGDQREVLSVAGDTGNLEYFLMSAVKRLINPKLPTVAIIDNSDGATEILRAVLERTYKVTAEKDAQVLVIIGLGDKMTNERSNELRNWLKEGKGLIVLADKYEIGSNLRSTKVEDKQLEQLLTDYGITVVDRLIMDTSSVIASFRGQSGTMLTRYPYWITIRPENTDNQNPVMSGLSALMLPWASPLKIDGGAKKLFSSSEESLTDEGINLEPGITLPETEEMQSEVVGAINTNGVRLAVIGDTDLIKDQFVVSSQQNISLLLNLIDYFTQENDLMMIRGKQLPTNLIKTVDEPTKAILKGLNMVAPVLILLTTWIVFRIKRKNDNKQTRSGN